MKYLGAISDPKDLVNKQYVDGYDSYYSSTYSLDNRGVGNGALRLQIDTNTTITDGDLANIRAYLHIDGKSTTDWYTYPLIIVQCYVSSPYIYVYFKSIYNSVQATSSSSITGYVHFLTPFPVIAVTTSM